MKILVKPEKSIFDKLPDNIGYRMRISVMIPTLLSIALVIAVGCASTPKAGIVNDVLISGRVTDFDGSPIPDATVVIKDEGFRDVAETLSGEDGSYSLSVPRGHYMALMAVKGYQISNLQFWAWSVPALNDLQIDPRFHKMEVYALNAWRVQYAGFPTYQIYFRPMGLSRLHKLFFEMGEDMEALTEFLSAPGINDFIAPNLEKDDILVRIGNQELPVLAINRVLEAASADQKIVGYLIQVPVPENTEDEEFSVLSVTVTDTETGDVGEGWLFIQKSPWNL